jgi:hypothetical protein
LVFIFLPALLLFSAAGLTRLLLDHRRRLVAAASILIAVNVGIFLLAPEYPLGGDRLRLLTRATLVNSDRYYEDRFEAIESSFPPESTAVLADNWRHVEYYLPSYPSLHFYIGAKWELDEGKATTNPEAGLVSPAELFGQQQDEHGQMVIVIFDPILEPFNATPERAEVLRLARGEGLPYFVLATDDVFQYKDGLFGITGR